ncbi:uncharacterized protein BT62DRAFT_1000006 [Guyanagaster necrorhizus]|uniref:Uncharacterized protein n=1 Tax=Guyanagaster necrorhizus TaxID=856835 RepID=A0A9P8AY99_9AGAR|nr:uncharacterized protein BT62DRAFT_1000006 [Guyanagaster necrorhizus MCA 3950]KAG7452255.1 hypothetical protein BT62DRAFT_1000006 [Guyanagaster necrorhizus MCA 3950]
MAKRKTQSKAAVQGSRSLLQSYLNLPAGTRLRLSLGFFAFAGEDAFKPGNDRVLGLHNTGSRGWGSSDCE